MHPVELMALGVAQIDYKHSLLSEFQTDQTRDPAMNQKNIASPADPYKIL